MGAGVWQPRVRPLASLVDRFVAPMNSRPERRFTTALRQSCLRGAANAVKQNGRAPSLIHINSARNAEIGFGDQH